MRMPAIHDYAKVIIMDRGLIKVFWNCGDTQIIEFAMMRARLNRDEKEVLTLALDECLSQERIAEKLDISTRKVQDAWASGTRKLLMIPWVRSYAKELRDS